MIMRKLNSRSLNVALAGGVSTVVMALSLTAQAQTGDAGDHHTRLLRYAQEIADGEQVVSQSKDIMMARRASADGSRFLYDTQNGAITIEHDGHTSVIPLISRVGVESRFSFDPISKRLSGNEAWIVAASNAMASASAETRVSIDLSTLQAGGQSIAVAFTLSRTPVVIDGVQALLIEFQAPPFSYTTPEGAEIVQWARGFAVIDRSSGDTYAAATQHRATLISGDGPIPLSIRTTLHAIRPDGAWKMKFDRSPEVSAALARLRETAGAEISPTDPDHSGSEAGGHVAGTAMRLDAAAFLALAGPGNPLVLSLAAADSSAALTGQLPVDAGVSASPSWPSDDIEAAMRSPAGRSPVPYAGAAQLAQTLADRVSSSIFVTAPAMPAVAYLPPEPEVELAASGPWAEEPQPPSSTPPDVGAALARFQAEMRLQKQLNDIIAAAQKHMRSNPNDQQTFNETMAQIQQQIRDMRADNASAKNPNDAIAEIAAAIRNAQQNSAGTMLDQIQRQIRDMQNAGSQANPSTVLDDLERQIRTMKSAPSSPQSNNDAIAKIAAKLQSLQHGQAETVLDQIERQIREIKNGSSTKSPTNVLDDIQRQIREMQSGASSRLVEGPLDSEGSSDSGFAELLVDLQAELEAAKNALKDDLIDGDWTDAEVEEINNFFANNAFDYTSMIGIIPTDLSRWGEWLATQNVRELERLAALAGYPNLASALSDAENIIRQSQDPGYRQWAMQAPSCNGPAGCGPSYLERWWMKQSIVALGDILADSRGIFSSGGFSDIGISGLNLAYLLRDHALEDGDIVQIRITQFGRVIYEGQVNLTNAGEVFNLIVGRGVASLEIFAVNEGFSSPNTAQITVDNVVRGEGTQTYSLNTGETATLRIEAGAKAGATGGTP